MTSTWPKKPHTERRAWLRYYERYKESSPRCLLTYIKLVASVLAGTAEAKITATSSREAGISHVLHATNAVVTASAEAATGRPRKFAIPAAKIPEPHFSLIKVAGGSTIQSYANETLPRAAFTSES
ncbi:NAD-dependent aldehyde dehydrogenase [Fusarium sp. NRRL 25303]|nr:NAD-dependent aldehyde dehydrogenase [Fusarium sp. NRRL 25303]